jgi:protein-S-isoprenylcysteine O-methyltransferase Ste14
MKIGRILPPTYLLAAILIMIFLHFLLPITILVGEGIILGSLTPWIAVAVFAVLIDRNFIIVEEKMLAERFGKEWQAYAARTRRSI